MHAAHSERAWVPLALTAELDGWLPCAELLMCRMYHAFPLLLNFILRELSEDNCISSWYSDLGEIPFANPSCWHNYQE
jgi:hypothetical protein